MAEEKSKVKLLVEQRDIMLKEMKTLQNKVEGLDIAIKILMESESDG